jgi:plastocyanin
MKKTALIALVSLWGVVSGVNASLTTTYSNLGNMSGTVGNLTNSLTVAVGDVVVMVSGTNKKDSINGMTFTSAAGTFVDLDANTQLGNDPNPNSYLSYLTVTTAGTYDFIATTDILGMTATVGAYTLSADSGEIELAGNNAKKYSGLAPGASLSVTNFMSWGSNPNAGDYGDIVTIGVGSSLKGAISNDGFSLDMSKAGKRLAGTQDATGSVNVKQIWDITNADATKNESGGITGAAFAEVIPEPATLGMVGVFGATIIFLRRRFMI